MSDVYVHTTALMGTVVTFQVVGHGEDAEAHARRVDAVDRAVAWNDALSGNLTTIEGGN